MNGPETDERKIDDVGIADLDKRLNEFLQKPPKRPTEADNDQIKAFLAELKRLAKFWLSVGESRKHEAMLTAAREEEDRQRNFYTANDHSWAA